MSGLRLCPVSLREANAFVERHHRHSEPTQGHKFSVGAAVGESLIGVAIVGRPVSKARQCELADLLRLSPTDSTIVYLTAEVLRTCTGPSAPKNTISFLHGACWRASRAMGYQRCITYNLKSESGASLRAAGYRVIGEVKPQDWNRPSRPRDPDHHEPQERLCWERAA